MNQNYQDKIDQYLLGQMTEDSRLAFEKDMEKDTELREQFEFTKDVKKVITDRNRRLEQIREWEQDYKNKRIVVKRQYIYWLSGIAAIFIVGFFLITPFNFDESEEMSNPVPMSKGSLRCGGSEYNSSIEKALGDRKFDVALAQIEDQERSLEEEKRQTEQEKANMDNDEYTYLQEVYKIQCDELRLFKACAFIGLKRTDEAISILDELRQKEGPFQMQADSLFNIYKK